MGLATVPFVAQRIPRVYRSETLIMVIPQRVPDSYVKSTVTASVEDRLPSISDQILSRSRLERIIVDFDLYKDVRPRVPMEDVVKRMRDDIGSPQIQAGAQSFRVSYTSQEPATAQRVAARLASLFIDENSRDRENLAESTNVFLESQLEDAKRRLLESEKKLQEYRQLHTGELPSQLESNLRAIQTAQLQLTSVSESANHASERRLLLERQLVDAQTLPIATQPIVTGSASPDASASLTPAQQLELALKNLELLRLRYTADHPDVRRLERTIEELKVRAADDAKRPPAPTTKTASQEEVNRQKRIRDLQADLEVIDHQLATSRTEEGRLKSLIDDYQKKVEVVPKRESELVELTRDYDILKKTYDSLLTKREDSKLSANLERRQIGEQFRILDAASLPVRPANEMKRLGFAFAGTGVGLALGLLLTAFLEFRDASFSRDDDVARVLNLPVLALVPVMATTRDRQIARRRRLMMDALGTLMLCASVGVVVAWGLRQL